MSRIPELYTIAKEKISGFAGKGNVKNVNLPKGRLNDVLRAVIDEYNASYALLADAGAGLYNARTCAVELIFFIEGLVNSIANRPKTFDTDIAEIQLHREAFKQASDYAKEELQSATRSGYGIGAGVAAGTAVASVAPSVAMWVATTYGTASTGAAISSLSGAAATKAALAWLGGGTLATGGGGVAGGQALLALAGPIGWGIAGASILSSIIIFGVGKFKSNKKKKEEIEQIKKNIERTKEMTAAIHLLLDEVNAVYCRLREQYENAIRFYEKDFLSLTDEQQDALGALVNNTMTLAASLGKRIE